MANEWGDAPVEATAPNEWGDTPVVEPSMVSKAANTGLGLGNAALTGLAEEGIHAAGSFGDVRNFAGNIAEKVGLPKGVAQGALGAIPIAGPIINTLGQIMPTSKTIGEAVGADKLYQPQTEPEKYAKTIGGMLPAALQGPGGFGRRVAMQAVVPGMATEAAGSLPGIKGTKAEPYVRAIAGLASPIAAERAISPFTTAAGRAAAVQTLRNEGVTDITAGQAVGSRRLRYQESELGGSTSEAVIERQGEQFTRAALRRAGEDAPRATPEIMDRAFTRIGNDFNQLSANNALQPDNRMARELGRALTGYERLVPPTQRTPAVQNAIDDIVAQFTAHNWQMPGDAYQNLRSAIGRDARALARDPSSQRTLYEIQGALDSAMERAIGRTNPNALGDWQRARREYRNLLVIERAANRAGEVAASGIISPANLATATRSLQGLRNYARGRGDFTQLARAGVEVMAPLPNSGTAQRLRAHSIPAIVSATIGGMLGSGAGPAGTAAGIASGVVAPRVMGEALLSPPMRRYLANRAIQERQTPQANLIRALLAGRT